MVILGSVNVDNIDNVNNVEHTKLYFYACIYKFNITFAPLKYKT